ncbi:MAG: hypothetical protein WD939_01355 [Dehalococcoidia bacterium]
MKKVELHCHIDGIVDAEMLRAMAAWGLEPPVSAEQLEAAYPVDGFDAFVRWEEVQSPLEGGWEWFKPILAMHIERLKAQDVVYAEIAIGSSELPRDQSEAVERMQEVRQWLNQEEAGRIQVELLVAFSRHRPPEFAEQLAERLLPLHEAGLIAGVVVAGPERGNPASPFRRALERMRDAGLGIEIHAGEWAGPESVWDALECSPHRIGHGVAVFDDPRLLEQVQKSGIHIEMCPTSNLKTGSIDRIDAHPVRIANELQLSFSVNTDDPGAFECSMESEFDLLRDLFGFDDAAFERIARNALAARFQPELRGPAAELASRF